MSDLEARAIRHMYRSDPRMFLQLAFRLLHPGAEYLPSWSADALGAALARCHRGESRRLLVNMPPGSLKSICASIAFPAWLLGVRPDLKVACIAGSKGVADDHHAMARALTTHPKYLSLFPHVRTSERPGQITLAQGGCRAAVTTGAALTGGGADVVIIDDPQLPQDADDPAKSEAARRWYDREIGQRLSGKQRGVVIVLTRRLAQDDLSAHLLAQGGWDHLCLPAIAAGEERLPGWLGGRVMRKAGEALHPACESREELRETMLRLGAKAFMAQYQQDPYPVGEGVQRCGAFHRAPYPDAPYGECLWDSLFFSVIPEEVFALDSVFGERTCIRQGTLPPLSHEEWENLCESMSRKMYGEAEQPAEGGPHPERAPPESARVRRSDRSRCQVAPCTEESIREMRRGNGNSWL